ncbi:MAG: fatty acid oxidation complex subunit alpha FadJ [Planctomycetes bacterium]|nr:fatty acid oxidation complex subunit alpha FadJ [Planctomycetota bacterium]
MSESKQSVLQVERRPDGVAVVRFDVPGEPVNVLRLDYAPEFERVLAELERDSAVRAVVITGKPDGFLAGADISALSAVNSAAEGSELSRRGQAIMNRIADFERPVVAAIHGVCLGGGLELALACDARVASDHRKTKLGLPEVQLGLLPGAGGTQRLPALVGAPGALDLMLTGKQLDGKRAKKLGLVDDVVPASIVVDVAAELALALVEGKGPSRGASLLSSEGLQELGLERNPLGRKILFDKAREGVMEKSKGLYPAPLKILDVVRAGLSRGLEAGLAAEAEAFGELTLTPEAKQLMGIYFATTALKKDRGADAEPRPLKKVGVLGAGLMGSGVAYVTAVLGKLQVRLKDRDAEGVARGLAAVAKQLDGRVKRRRMTSLERDQHLARVTGTTDYSGFKACDVVIEAVFEDLQLKHTVLKQTEAATGPETIFASNTSSLPIAEIAAASARPETVIGMHYFSPVEKMPLLEIIVTEHTAPWVTATCVELGKRQGKTVIVVRDGPGFYTTRILAPYMNEAARLVGEGVRIEAVDEALVGFGFPVGPVTLMDEVGIDVGGKVCKIMEHAFGARMTPPEGLEKLLADDRLGRKNKRGFYRYDGSKQGGHKPVDTSVYGVLGVEPGKDVVDAEETAWRVTLLMVNEAAHCFADGILRSARDGDIGAIFGLGFPPFRGGPFRLIDSETPQGIVDRLRRLEAEHGERFAPAPLLLDMAEQGLSFYGEKRVEPRAPARA